MFKVTRFDVFRLQHLTKVNFVVSLLVPSSSGITNVTNNLHELRGMDKASITLFKVVKQVFMFWCPRVFVVPSLILHFGSLQ